MRRGTGWNVGMLSHPNFLNTLLMNEAAEYRRTEEDNHTRPHEHRPPGQKIESRCACTHEAEHIYILEEVLSIFFVRTLTAF